MPTSHVRVAVIGAGFGGLGMAVGLLRAGIRDFVLLERGDDVGGTWRDNTYPGCRCDIPSHLYSFSFAPNPRWRRSFSGGQEIWDYLTDVTDRFGIRPHLRLGVEVTQARWSDDDRSWQLSTTAGTYTSDVVVIATGALSEPAVPQLPGLPEFRGEVFHSARWRHDYDLAGKRVAVVGTGASTIQIVPKIAPLVRQLHLFQRTPPWVLPLTDRRIGAGEQRMFDRFPLTQRAIRTGIYWGREALVVGFVRTPAVLRLAETIAAVQLRRQVPDPQLRTRLTPDYRIGCKRILMSNDYYPALTRPNVEVISSGLRALTEQTVLADDGTERAVDAVVFGTGFHVTDSPIARRVWGRDGRRLADAWAEDGMQALRGTAMAGFPNAFIVVGPNTGQGHSSMLLMIESQVAYIVDALRTMDRRGLSTLEPTAAAQDRWNATIRRRMRRTVWVTGGCASWYHDSSGRVTTQWPASTWRFRLATRRLSLGEYRAVPSGAPPAPATEPSQAVEA